MKKFKDSAEIADFFNENKNEILERYKKHSKNAKTLNQKISIKHCAINEVIAENEYFTSECQANKIFELYSFWEEQKIWQAKK